MSDVEKEILKNMDTAISKMSEFEKGYILGMAESKVAEKKNQKEPDVLSRQELDKVNAQDTVR